MITIPNKIETWQMVAPGKMVRATIEVPKLKPGEVLVEVAVAVFATPTIRLSMVECPQ
jgi:NADPH:quinone reductase-like Zn-dependent oxidoreductase